MPCYDGRDNDASELKLSEARKEISNLQYYLNGYAQMLCDHCTKLEAEGHGHLIVGHIKNWWEGHKKFDKDRKAKTREDLK